jgi:predicted Zn-dependent peptidase
MLFSFVVGSSSVNLPKIQKLFSQVIHSIFEGNITDEDFNRAKNYMLGQLFFGLDEVQIASLNSIYSTGYVFSNYKVFYDYGEIYKYVEGLEKSEFISFIKRVFSKYITGEGFIEGVIVVS